MDLQPSLADFVSQADHQRVIPVWTTVMADDWTPVGLYDHLTGAAADSFLLESVEAGVWSRYSFIGISNVATLTARDGAAVWRGQRPEGLPETGDPLQVLEETLAALHTERADELPPLVSGLVGYLSYDVVRRWENIGDSNPDELGIPELNFALVGDIAVYDHHTGRLHLVANAINLDGSADRVEEAYADAVARVEKLRARLDEPRRPWGEHHDPSRTPGEVVRRTSSEDYQQIVRDAVEEIRAGEIFQVVPSQRFEIETAASPLAIYRQLRHANPSPYMYLYQYEDFAVVGSSPEALVTVSGGRVTTHPIAGTRPRSEDPTQDAAHEADLLADPKERAEHLMLVDLGRNDVGRVSKPGTVAVTEFMQVRRYSHVMHLESTVTGELADGQTPLGAVRACFPAGTLSGAPKVRAMEIIERVESTRRGLYGGVVGYFDLAGNADMAIAIRTAVIKDGRAIIQAGGGVVADSDPVAEDTETVNKAKAVVRAIGLAEQWSS
ncbi:anthranilate synthase component I [Parenemella sanctibonifatiensis]|uniref:Anthranilate synthase component 1 n=1 Tax=Parenemella sanctibonifatiensis TaxID=2016505 RepID=A0A255EN05_9ACTN|nr:anthranilate synthase component I [Parenemella sanctibonifatiensis]OYN86569.1 anthranilate synthase component I [Parenemella sanctibonifatiensis]OYN90995.1 anthranilate synthase component I [Parenemella sanctibonifatiensis]